MKVKTSKSLSGARHIFILLFGVVSFGVSAQYTLFPNAYLYDQSYTNAAVGLDDDANADVSLYGKTKFIDNEVWHKPMNFFANYRGRMGTVPGFYSVGYGYDGYSFFDRNVVSLTYSYQYRFSEKADLKVGARAVLNLDNVKWDKLDQLTQKTEQSVYFNPDFDFGAQLTWNRFSFGISNKNLFANNTKIDGEIFLQNQREWYANASYLFPISENILLTPYTLLRLERNISLDLGMRFSLYNFVDIGYHFRLSNLCNVISLGIIPTDNIKIGVAMDNSLLTTGHNLDFWLAYSW